ncbi:hypothetical protein GE061_019195 [Apolygus lucorum]|uniref:Uncharacterized protein n=1 Tax=Apolygus lucorum TaxID=248454 RepID=A0A8S9X9M6_APOLU|nr:hypothetical protein GE061_019195 [Apolygus lucorum]
MACSLPLGLNPSRLRTLKRIAQLNEAEQPPIGLIPLGVRILIQIGVLNEDCPPPPLRILKRMIQKLIGEPSEERLPPEWAMQPIEETEEYCEEKPPLGLTPARLRTLKRIAQLDEWQQPPIGLIPLGVHILKQLIMDTIGEPSDERYHPARVCECPQQRPRNPARYVRKRFNEGMGCLQRAFSFNYPM